MAQERRGPVRKVLGGLWWLLDGSRRVFFNLIFLAIVGAVVYAFVVGGPPKLDDKTVLVLDLSGPLVEQRTANARDAALQMSGQDGQQARLRDVLAVLDAAAKDPKIERVLLLLDDLSGGGLALQREVAAAIVRFKASGKQVLAWGSVFDQRRYYLAAHASEVYLDPMGAVVPEGYGSMRSYYRAALDRLGVSANVVRVGKFKNAAEPLFASEPSKETLEAEAYLYDALWSLYMQGVEKARQLPEGSLAKGIDALPASLKAVGGDVARLALDSKLVDGLKTREEMRRLLIERGAADTENKTFRQVSFSAYLARLKPPTAGGAVGVIVTQGQISDGKEPTGRVGGRSTADLIRKAREDDQIKAVVLRVDSPGGSAYGSELVRRELELARAAGKPVVVSMGDVAASGGYWISLAADEMIADPATITGSIGVFGLLPTAEGLMDKLSVHTAGYSTTWLGSAYDPRKALEPRFGELVQSTIDRIYADFIAHAAAARKTTPEKIDAVAQGRVWTGDQAKERGLVDRTGSYMDALDAARTRAKLGADAPVTYIEVEAGRLERFVEYFSASVAHALPLPAAMTWLQPGIPAAALGQAEQDFGWLAEAARRRQPFAAVVHCLCEPAP